MRTTIMILTAALLSYLPLYAQAGDDSAEAAKDQMEEVKVDDSKDNFSSVPKKGDLRLTGSVYFAKQPFQDVNGKDQEYSIVGWRGVFDYHLYDIFSLSGTAHIPFTDANKLRAYFMALGFNLHPLQFGDFDTFLGASAGFLTVQHELLASKSIPALNFGVGLALHGSFFHLVGEVNYQRAEYFSRNTFIDFNQVIYSVGIGMKL